MASIKLTDKFKLNIDSAPGPGSLFSKYLKNPGDILAVLRNATPIKDLTIGDDPLNSVAIGLSFSEPLSFGSAGSVLAISPSMSGSISIERGALFDANSDPFRESIPIPAESAFLRVALNMQLAGDLDNTTGELQFGFNSGTAVSITNYRLFALSDRIIPAIEQGFQRFTVPGDFEDIDQLQENCVVTVEGSGSLTISAAADLISSVNPLATLNTGILPIKVIEGASLSVGASFTLAGEYQLRIERLAGKKFRLGYEKKRTSRIDVSVAAKLGVSVQAGGFDLIRNVLQMVSGDPVADKEQFRQSGLTDEQIGNIAGAIKSGIERNLAISLAGELDSLTSSATAFSYEIDGALLDSAGKKAVQDALAGDLTGVEHAGVAGITPRRSVFATVQERKISFKVNLLGIFTYGSVSNLFQNGTIIVDRDSGDITITDEAGADRIQFTTDNFARDTSKLRRVLAESLLITAAYRGSGALNTSPQFNSRYWIFDLNQKTNLQQISDYLNIAQVLKLVTNVAVSEHLQIIKGTEAFGRSTFYLHASYTNALFQRMFLNANKKPRTEEEYETLGRNALLLLLPPGDAINDARRLPLLENAIWNAMKNAGQPGFPILFQPRGFNANQIADITSDYSLIAWWATSMNRMGQAVAAIVEFVEHSPALDPENKTFKTLRNNLEREMASVVRNTKSQFSEPWGFVAMDLSSDQQADLSMQLISSRLVIASDRAIAKQ